MAPHVAPGVDMLITISLVAMFREFKKVCRTNYVRAFGVQGCARRALSGQYGVGDSCRNLPTDILRRHEPMPFPGGSEPKQKNRVQDMRLWMLRNNIRSVCCFWYQIPSAASYKIASQTTWFESGNCMLPFWKPHCSRRICNPGLRNTCKSAPPMSGGRSGGAAGEGGDARSADEGPSGDEVRGRRACGRAAPRGRPRAGPVRTGMAYSGTGLRPLSPHLLRRAYDARGVLLRPRAARERTERGAGPQATGKGAGHAAIPRLSLCVDEPTRHVTALQSDEAQRVIAPLGAHWDGLQAASQAAPSSSVTAHHTGRARRGALDADEKAEQERLEELDTIIMKRTNATNGSRKYRKVSNA